MNNFKTLILPLLLVLLLVAACDSDSGTSNAQEPTTTSCPCFDKDKLLDAVKNSGPGITCTIEGIGMVLDAGGPLGGLAEVFCMPNSNQCECRFETDIQDNLNFIEVEQCLNIMFDVLVDSEKEGLSFDGCTLNTILPSCN
ncbi:MAG: hypothetical protein AAF462_03935 [Thermodesulfobacteriota bacterium]